MGTPFAVTAANAFMYYHERDIIELYAQHLTLYMRFIDDIFVIRDGTRDILLEFLSAMNAKDERIKLTYEISDSKIPFLDLLLFKDSASPTLQYSTFQKPLNKYLYIPFESFHPTSNKKAFIKGEPMRYARNSFSFSSFTETRLLFWKRLRLRCYLTQFLLPIFREISYSNRCKWFSKSRKISTQRRVACVASVPVRKKSSQTIFRKQAARKLGREIEGTLASRPPIFEKRPLFLTRAD